MLTLISTAIVALAIQSPTRSLPPALGPLNNPLKGFAAYSDPSFIHTGPVSMAYASASWKELEPTEGHYDFESWEKRQWNTPLAKGKPIVFRVFLDYPSQPTGVPDWLVQRGVRMTPYDDFGGGLTPDYENPDLKAGLGKLIRALGKRYDSNPRIAFVEVGLLGFWGEWHTYPHAERFASEATQRMVLEDMKAAFPHKLLMARNPSYASSQEPWLGYHDDMIPEDTLGPEAWDFLPSMRKAGRQENWHVAPIGGEMVPGAAKKYLGESWDQLVKAVKVGHMTWIGPYCPPLETPPSPVYRARMAELVRILGYEFRWTKIQAPNAARTGQNLSVRLAGVNQGNAPFYYPWKARLALLDSAGRTVQTQELADDVRTWQPGPIEVSATLPVSVAPGAYKLGIGIIDPLSGVPDVAFANDLERISGYTVVGLVHVVKPLTK